MSKSAFLKITYKLECEDIGLFPPLIFKIKIHSSKSNLNIKLDNNLENLYLHRSCGK